MLNPYICMLHTWQTKVMYAVWKSCMRHVCYILVMYAKNPSHTWPFWFTDVFSTHLSNRIYLQFHDHPTPSPSKPPFSRFFAFFPRPRLDVFSRFLPFTPPPNFLFYFEATNSLFSHIHFQLDQIHLFSTDQYTRFSNI